jgi:hypothetical protein
MSKNNNDKTGCRINSKLCSTCIFTNNSPVDDVRFRDLKRSWESDKSGQQCHHSTLQNDNVMCRGHYNAAKKGDVYHPVVETSQKFFNLSDPEMNTPEFVCTLAERMGLIVFVDVIEDKKDK